MTEFIILCIAMLIVAVLLIARPLLRKPTSDSKAPVDKRPTASIAATAVVLPLVAAGLYGFVSNFPWDDPLAADPAAAGAHAQGAGSMDEATARLEARLAENPQDLDGWRMLARSYLITGQPAKAATALERAIEVSGGSNPGLELDLAEAWVVTGDPAAMERAKPIVEAALSADGNNEKALWYSGVIAARSGDTETAKVRWTTMLEQNPPEEIRQLVNEQLAALGAEVPQADAPASGPVVAAAPPGTAKPAAGAAEGRAINVSVSIDPSLAGQLKPGTPLFISARQPGIPGPPLAALRLTSDDLPLTVTLSDANAMIEGRNLSSVEDVQVVARVAFGGSVMTTSGDLFGEATHAKGAAPDVAVVIDKVAP